MAIGFVMNGLLSLALVCAACVSVSHNLCPRFAQETEMPDATSQQQPDHGEGKAALKRVEKDVTALKNDIVDLSRQIAALNTLTGPAQKQAKRGYKNARANVDSMVSDASERVGIGAEAAYDAATSVGNTLESAIQERPLATLAIVLGLGFLIGVTWRR